MKISAFSVGDGQALVDAWNLALPGDPITSARFRNLILLDVNFDPAGLFVARSESGEVIGAAYAVRRTTAAVGPDLEPTKGWLPFFFVIPSARGRGAGRSLVSAALEWLGSYGRKEADFASYTPNYVLPGLDRAAYPAAAKLLELLGFRTLYQASAMDRSLVDYVPPSEPLGPADYSFGTPSTDELVPLIRLASDGLENPDWARVIREEVARGMPLDRIVVARDESGDIVGWAMFGAYDGVVERFGPFGVRPDQRGKRLGEALLHLALQRMRAEGAHSAWFLWTGEQSPAGHLYRKTGFATTRKFDVMRCSL